MRIDWNAAAKATGHFLALCVALASLAALSWLVIWLVDTKRYVWLVSIPFAGSIWFWSFCYGEYRIDNMRKREREQQP